MTEKKKSDVVNMTNMSIRISKKLKKKLKHYVIDHELNINKFTGEAIEDFLNRGVKNEPKST